MHSRTIRLLPAVLIATTLAACSDDDESGTTPDAGIATDTGADTVGADATTDTNMEEDSGTMEVTADMLFELGSYPVGYAETSFTYDPPGDEDAREIPVKVWYPASPDNDAEGTAYAVAGIVEIETEVALDEPAPASDGPFPVVVYSHGSGGEGLLAYPYGEYFASRGWILVSPNHVGNTALDGIAGSFAPIAQTTLYRVTDISALLDAVEAGLEADVSLTGLADTNRVFLFGHSFGGYTTFAAGGGDIAYESYESGCGLLGGGSCDFLAQDGVADAFRAGFGDARIDAIAPQAPALIPSFDSSTLAGIEVPIMMQTGRLDRTTTQTVQAEPAWEATGRADDIWVEMPDGAHFSFITICDDLEPALLAAFQPDAPEDGCGDQFIPVSEAVPVLRAYLIAFAELHVLGVEGWRDIIYGPALADGFEITLGE